MNSCVHYRLLKNTTPTAPPDTRRWWVEMGHELPLTQDVQVRVLRQRQHCQERYALHLAVCSSVGDMGEYLLQEGEALDMSDWLAVLVVPRALRLERGRPQAALLEVRPTARDPQWTQAGWDCIY